ncbi:MAG TPA: transposase [Flavitalea sp.]|nr:transposase [Flavitalea sp.]
MTSIKNSGQRSRTSFEKAVILDIVHQRETGASSQMLCRKYGMVRNTLRIWMNRYGSSTYKSEMRVPHTLQQIRPIVRAILEGRLTYQEAAIKCTVSLACVKTWVRNFQKEDADLPVLKQDDMPTPAHSPTDNVLLQELETARLKIKALETMIEVAEEQFKIPIRKKFGAKQ